MEHSVLFLLKYEADSVVLSIGIKKFFGFVILVAEILTSVYFS
jgi:hypothetical protein